MRKSTGSCLVALILPLVATLTVQGKPDYFCISANAGLIAETPSGLETVADPEQASIIAETTTLTELKEETLTAIQ